MKLVASLLASLIMWLLTATPAQAELVLAVNEGVTYYVTPTEIREKYKDLADLIGRHLKTTVRIVPVDQYPILRKGKDAQMKQPADMKGKRFGMPDSDSITAVITRATMRDLGIDSAKAEIRTTRYQDAVPFFVENGFSDVGVSASGAVIKQWQEKGGAVLFESKAVPIKHMIASTKMSDTDLEKVRALMLGLDKSEAGQKILAKIGYKGYESGDPQQLAVLAKWLGY